MKKALIIGGGFAGCAAAHQFALKGGWDVTLVEATAFLGAGVRTQFYGGHPYTFGPRHFLTRNEQLYAFLDRYLPLRPCDHLFLTYVEGDSAFYNYPIHRDDVPRMPERERIETELTQVTADAIRHAANLEEYWIASVGRTLYDKFVNTYSRKMWMVDDNRKIDDFGWSPKGVALKQGPVRVAWSEALSAYPHAADGYNSYFDLATAEARVLVNTTITHYDVPHRRVFFNDQWHSYDIIVNSISPDLLFEQCHGELPYVGRDFHKFVLPIEHAFPEDVYFLYYAGSESFTRLVEYKKFTKHGSPHTLIGMEIPSTNGRHYPLPFKSEYERAQKYLAMLPENVYSIGRAGSYHYKIDIDDCIEQAMAIGKTL